MVLAQPRPTPAARLNARPVTLAVIVGNRGFFPAHLAGEGRRIILEVLQKAGINAIITPEADTNNGAIESLNLASALQVMSRICPVICSRSRHSSGRNTVRASAASPRRSRAMARAGAPMRAASRPAKVPLKLPPSRENSSSGTRAAAIPAARLEVSR